MRGSYNLVVGNKRVQYKLTVRRNITILRGDSATGKTTLIEMIAEYEANGDSSGVSLSCDKSCTVLSGNRWEIELKAIDDCIVFIDEGSPFVTSKDFARAIRRSGNYYVIATRASLFELPYSVDEVYGIRNVTRSKYEQVWRLYSNIYPLYGERANAVSPDVVIVEDSNAGFEFFKALCAKSGIRCISAGGRARVRKAILSCGEESVMVIADGAAFGPEMEGVLALRQVRNVSFFLPESFEWLILRSGLVKDSDIPAILEDPSGFIESARYFSWERFFTWLLVDRTKETYLRYGKNHLNEAYLNDREMESIASQVPRLGEGSIG